ncbi:hypothetical protein ACH4FX_12275 [Streptomyces sp. NPDC018019]|uniref:hypothetical protein n=1 Tax=Streptomyces sp. NPDC018019 TaxID=3365030 RepID=UPI00378F18CC
MSIRDKIFGTREAIEAHRRASEDLEAQTDPDSDEFLAANDRKGETAKDVPWFRR